MNFKAVSFSAKIAVNPQPRHLRLLGKTPLHTFVLFRTLCFVFFRRKYRGFICNPPLTRRAPTRNAEVPTRTFFDNAIAQNVIESSIDPTPTYSLESEQDEMWYTQENLGQTISIRHSINPSTDADADVVANPSTDAAADVVANLSTAADVVANPSTDAAADVVANPSTDADADVVANPSTAAAAD
jgi:hypothetical protein